MLVENLLAEIKTACGYSKMEPNSERLCFLGRLAQAMKLHVKCGGNDNRKLTRDDMLKRGIPIRAAAAGKSARNKKQSRTDLSWVNAEMRRFVSAQPARSKDERKRRRRELFQTWRNMTPRQNNDATASLPVLISTDDSVAAHPEASEEVGESAQMSHQRYSCWRGHSDWPLPESALEAALGSFFRTTHGDRKSGRPAEVGTEGKACGQRPELDTSSQNVYHHIELLTEAFRPVRNSRCRSLYFSTRRGQIHRIYL